LYPPHPEDCGEAQKKRRPPLDGPRYVILIHSDRKSGGDRPTAAARVAEADVAAAAALAARFQAVAAGLEHLAALCVSAGARDAAAVLGVLAAAVAAAQADIANLHAVPGALARAGAVAQGLAKALQGGAGDLIVAGAVDAESTLAFLEPQLAPRHHAHIGRGSGRRRRGRIGGRRSGRKSTPTFHDSAGHT
jgi:hypothetical protein